jgi:hypothetical protein
MTLSALDRCDQCAAQAVVQADHLTWATTLLLCAHHYKQHATYLSSVLAVIVDHRNEWEASR